MTAPSRITSEKTLYPVSLVVYFSNFHPRLGGLETDVHVLAIDWARMGDDVTFILNVLRSGPHRAGLLPPSSFQFTLVSGFASSLKAGIRSSWARGK
ncbi:MAG: hypothetical protein K9N47_07490 [Prosthecobacter sp.]|uniref:hypothetical protein n=1 Tax=Prosthecobacter sp. TaxID=1965333 RepID=UPI0025EB0D9E|nr:hypothetical protein [Prosthecobacter sp.]MCF7785949.1 hypothetical protein [Prosthecobacter sp.]